MADKSISELVAATSVGSTDLFVLEQANTAKKLTGQILENWLVSFADGHGGIQSIAKTGSAGTNPVVDTYTITLADETTFSFTVTNGLKGDQGDQTYVHIKWASQEPTADNQMSNLPDEWIGIYVGLSSSAPTAYTSYSWYQYKGDKGDTGTGITFVTRTSGTGAPGTTDTYTMYADSDVVGAFTVYNGSDGQGAPGSATPLEDTVDGVVGTAVAYSREDHQHPLNVASSGTPEKDGVASLGTADTYAATDHVHPLNVDATNPADLGTASPGTASTYARRDHVHDMPGASDVGAMKGGTVLWSNNAGSLAAGTITLSSGDYDYYIVDFQLTSTDRIVSQVCRKGVNTYLFLAHAVNGSTSDSLFASRDITYVSDTSLTVTTGVIARLNGQTTYNDGFVIPKRIVGIKF